MVDAQVGAALACLDVWRIDLRHTQALAAGWKTLSAPEQARAERFCRTELRERYILAHGAMRLLLAEYVQQAAEALEFTHNAWGKPQLVAHPWLAFNLSHAHDLAVLAVAHTGEPAVSRPIEVGVDVEWQRPAGRVDRLDLAKRFFAPAEYAALQAQEGDIARAFFRCWTCKEAYIKAKGMGLSLPLERFVVECRPGRPPALLVSEAWPEDPARFHYWEIAVPAGFVANLACNASLPGGYAPRCLDWPG